MASTGSERRAVSSALRLEEGTVLVFISSTWKDLQAEREALERALQRAARQFVGMEYFGSRPETPKETCLSEVDRSSVYVGVFGFRYGTVDSGTGRSLTELEYRRAQRRGLPCLIYFKDEQASYVSQADAEPALVKKLACLKLQLAAKHTISYFRTPDELSTKLLADLMKLMGDQREPQRQRPRRLLRTLRDVPDNVDGDWVIICGGKREEIPIGRERDLLAVSGDPRELTWVLKLGLPERTIVADDKCQDFLDFLLREEKRNLIAVGSPAVNFFVRQHQSDAFFRYFYEAEDLERYKSREDAETKEIKRRTAANFSHDFAGFVERRKTAWEEIKRFWKGTQYVVPVGLHPNEVGAVQYFGLVSLALHPYHDDRIAVLAGGSRFVSTVAALRMLGDRRGLRSRELGGIVSVSLHERRRGFDVYGASYAWQTTPYRLRDMLGSYERMLVQGECHSRGYTEEEVRTFIRILRELVVSRR